MAYSQDQIDALKAALARGALEYQKGDERVRFGSRSEMREQLREMEAEVNGLSRTSYLRRLTPRTSRGL